MSLAQSMGVRVKEMKMETRLTMRVVVAKGTKKRPAREVIMAMGSMTTTLVPAEARMATVWAEAPSRAAVQRASGRRAAAPAAARRRTMLSRTTMELDTRMPAERPMARRVARLRVRPASCMNQKDTRMVTGMVTATTKVERRFSRKAKRMRAQRATEEAMSERVLSTLAWTISASSWSQRRVEPGGSSRRISSVRRLTSRTVSTVLPSDFLTTLMATPGTPSR